MALFFAERNAAKNGALLLAKNGENGAFQKKFERKKLAKMALFKRRTGFPQVVAPSVGLFVTVCAAAPPAMTDVGTFSSLLGSIYLCFYRVSIVRALS